MPSTKHKVAHRPRRAKSPDRAEEIELATVYLELKSWVVPTWGRCVEPDSYITDLEGDILLPRSDADDEICLGTISAHSVHFDEASEYGVSWFDVLDARSADTAMYIDLIEPEGSSYTGWVESAFEPFGSNLLILDCSRIEPEHRGHGYGLYAAQLMITGFASSGIVACVPAPYELLKDAPPREIGTRYHSTSTNSWIVNSNKGTLRSLERAFNISNHELNEKLHNVAGSILLASSGPLLELPNEVFINEAHIVIPDHVRMKIEPCQTRTPL